MDKRWTKPNRSINVSCHVGEVLLAAETLETCVNRSERSRAVIIASQCLWCPRRIIQVDAYCFFIVKRLIKTALIHGHWFVQRSVKPPRWRTHAWSRAHTCTCNVTRVGKKERRSHGDSSRSAASGPVGPQRHAAWPEEGRRTEVYTGPHGVTWELMTYDSLTPDDVWKNG